VSLPKRIKKPCSKKRKNKGITKTVLYKEYLDLTLLTNRGKEKKLRVSLIIHLTWYHRDG
jgi:hypothetical protein